LPELTGSGGDAAGAGELGVGGKALGAGDLADQLARGQRPEAGLGQQLRCDLVDELRGLGLELVDRQRQLAQVAQLVASNANARRLLAPRQPCRATLVVHFIDNNAQPWRITSRRRPRSAACDRLRRGEHGRVLPARPDAPTSSAAIGGRALRDSRQRRELVLPARRR
jgi:hypothetical protein